MKTLKSISILAVLIAFAGCEPKPHDWSAPVSCQFDTTVDLYLGFRDAKTPKIDLSLPKGYEYNLITFTEGPFWEIHRTSHSSEWIMTIGIGHDGWYVKEPPGSFTKCIHVSNGMKWIGWSDDRGIHRFGRLDGSYLPEPYKRWHKKRSDVNLNVSIETDNSVEADCLWNSILSIRFNS